MPIIERLRNLLSMRRLFLVRHAKAEPSVGRDDYARKLTGRGRADARRVAKALAARHFLPDVLIHSGAARAKETAEIFVAAWRDEVKLREQAWLYDASLTTLLDHTRALGHEHKRVGLVGHNPGLGALATALTGSGAEPELRRLAAKYPTGAVAVLDFSIQRWEEVAPNAAMLALYLTPAELEADADQEPGTRSPTPRSRSGSA
ncbi:MAG TPA: histidine phosphatase family protein [Roseiarcus sp.]